MNKSSEVDSAQSPETNSKSHFVATLFSAFVPGAGQLYLGRRRQGLVLLGIFVSTVICLWPLRLPRFFAGLILVALVWFGVSLYSSYAAMFKMENTLFKGDHFIADTHYFRSNTISRNDLVVLRESDYVTVKRVIAVSGDVIEGKDRKITVNGNLLEEPFIQHSQALGTNPTQDTFGPVKVPAGKYFVLGDNRDVSFDSRSPGSGLQDTQTILGLPLYIYR